MKIIPKKICSNGNRKPIQYENWNGAGTIRYDGNIVLVFIKKEYPEDFAFFVLRDLDLFASEACKFLKKKANFYLILLFVNVCKQTFHISHVRISQNVKGVLMRNIRHIFL